MSWRTMAVFLLVGALSGCASTESVQVSSITAKNVYVGDKTFTIVSDDYRPVESDLGFSEYARQVSDVLREQGYVAVKRPSDAKMLIALSYHVGPPQTQTQIVNTPVYPMRGPLYAPGYGYYYPMWNYPLYEPMVYQFTIYSKWLRLQAIDAAAYAKDKTVKPLWDAQAVSNNENGDLRYMFPYMLTALKPYIGTDSGHTVSVSVPTDSPDVQALRMGQ